MIATEYEERSTDKERRNELHQKWLEQQDAAGTDNLMQRLKCGSVLKDTFLSDNEPETDEDDEKDEEIDDEAEEDSMPKESGRINIRKAKQIILQLYSDKEDTYLSDDDDDMQSRRAQCLFRKVSFFKSFGLIWLSVNIYYGLCTSPQNRKEKKRKHDNCYLGL